MPELITQDEAAALLGLSKKTIQRYIREGKLKRVRQGRHSLVEKSQVKNLKRTRTDDHPAGPAEGVITPAPAETNLDPERFILVTREHYEELLEKIGALSAQVETLTQGPGAFDELKTRAREVFERQVETLRTVIDQARQKMK